MEGKVVRIDAVAVYNRETGGFEMTGKVVEVGRLVKRVEDRAGAVLGPRGGEDGKGVWREEAGESLTTMVICQ